MESWSLKLLGLLLLMLVEALNLVAAQREGFVSIDCGSTTNYTDDLGIEWTTDEPYTGSGKNVELKAGLGTRQMSTLRAFPSDRSRHCYYMPGSEGFPFLLRISFLHGGFEDSIRNNFSWSVDRTPLDSGNWVSDTFDLIITREYVFIATSNRVSFCLVASLGTMFLNALELRPLKLGMYDIQEREDRFLKMLHRSACGRPLQDPPVRYPDDIYDRLWTGFRDDRGLTAVATSKDVEVNLQDNPPAEVMRTGLTSNGSFSLSFDIAQDDFDLSTQFYVSLSMADVVDDNFAPSIDIYLNDKPFFANLTLQIPNRGYGLKSLGLNLTEARVELFFNRSLGSPAPPIVSVVEIYIIRAAFVWVTSSDEVEALEEVKNQLGLRSWVGDPCVPFPFNWLHCIVIDGRESRVQQINLTSYNLSGTISPRIAELTALTELRLADNKIVGDIPDLGRLSKLQILQLQNNSLTGGIPSSLATLSSLTELDVSNNDLSGPIPAVLATNPDLVLRTNGNPNLCEATEDCSVLLSPSQPRPPVEAVEAPPPLISVDDVPEKGGVSMGTIVGGVAGGVVALVAVLGTSVWCFCRRKRGANSDLPPLAGSQPKSKVGKVHKIARAFSLAEVRSATSDYERVLGQGGYGIVYYGKLSDGTELAVKVNSDSSKQGHQEFINEVSLLSRVNHRNLVCLLGYCEEKDRQILIYEFMVEGTLQEHLYGIDMRSRLTWLQRIEIALNAAKGLEYLHHQIRPRIIHRDIKSSNILLDGKMEAKVADFGICKSPHNDLTTGVSTDVKGTKGYLDPEYFHHSRLTYKSDVYSFGVILLELLCGRPAIFCEPGDLTALSLVDWARKRLRAEDLDSIVDPSLSGTSNQNSLWKMAEVAMDCVEPKGVHRPDIKQVIRKLSLVHENETSEQNKDVMTGHIARSPVAPLGEIHSSSTADFTGSSSYAQCGSFRL